MTLVVRNSLVDASLWILHLIDSFGGNLSHPCLKGSALEGRDGLDDVEEMHDDSC